MVSSPAKIIPLVRRFTTSATKDTSLKGIAKGVVCLEAIGLAATHAASDRVLSLLCYVTVELSPVQEKYRMNVIGGIGAVDLQVVCVGRGNGFQDHLSANVSGIVL
jgi:hypothetical protein